MVVGNDCVGGDRPLAIQIEVARSAGEERHGGREKKAVKTWARCVCSAFHAGASPGGLTQVAAARGARESSAVCTRPRPCRWGNAASQSARGVALVKIATMAGSCAVNALARKCGESGSFFLSVRRAVSLVDARSKAIWDS